jgi:thymidylate synthase (FAD)
VYAEKICELVADWVPAAYAAFVEHRLGAETISASGLAAIRKMLAGEEVTQETSGMSKGEWRELMSVLEK